MERYRNLNQAYLKWWEQFSRRSYELLALILTKLSSLWRALLALFFCEVKRFLLICVFFCWCDLDVFVFAHLRWNFDQQHFSYGLLWVGDTCGCPLSWVPPALLCAYESCDGWILGGQAELALEVKKGDGHGNDWVEQSLQHRAVPRWSIVPWTGQLFSLPFSSPG
jgi:hypothetical protein